MPVRVRHGTLALLLAVSVLGGCSTANRRRSYVRPPSAGVRPPATRPVNNRPTPTLNPATPHPTRTAGTPRQPPTPAIISYLAFIKTTEEHRQMLLSDTSEVHRLQNSAAQEQREQMLDAASGESVRPTHDHLREYAQELDRHYSNWVALLQCLDSHKPPAECVNLATAYRTSVYIETATIWQMRVAIQRAAGGNIEGLRQATAELTAMRADPRVHQSLDAAERDCRNQLRALRGRYELPANVIPQLPD